MELKPCPFCGGDKFAFVEQTVFCMKCHVAVILPDVMNETFEYQDPKDTWNTRASETPNRERIIELVEELSDLVGGV